MAPLSSAIKLQQCTRTSVSAHKFSLLKDPGDVFVFTELLGQRFGLAEGPQKKESNPVGGGGGGIKKCLALARNGGLNHLLKIFNDISVFLV